MPARSRREDQLPSKTIFFFSVPFANFGGEVTVVARTWHVGQTTRFVSPTVFINFSKQVSQKECPHFNSSGRTLIELSTRIKGIRQIVTNVPGVRQIEQRFIGA